MAWKRQLGSNPAGSTIRLRPASGGTTPRSSKYSQSIPGTSSLAERTVRDREAVGSIPTSPTKRKNGWASRPAVLTSVRVGIEANFCEESTEQKWRAPEETECQWHSVGGGGFPRGNRIPTSPTNRSLHCGHASGTVGVLIRSRPLLPWKPL